MGREDGGGFRMGNTCIPVADSFCYLSKLIQFVKFKNKIKLKKKTTWMELEGIMLSEISQRKKYMTSFICVI